MKNIIKSSFALALGFALFTGCIKEIDPMGSSGVVTVNQVGSYETYVTGLTNSLSGNATYSGSASSYANDFGYTTFFIMWDAMGNDVAQEDGNDWYSAWYSCGTTLGPQYAYCQMPWTCFYGWIRNCNNVLSLAGDNPDKDHITGAGIAYALRAMFYMDLARMFSQKTYGKDLSAETVPLVLETTALDDMAHNPRATNEVMWAQILSDLDKAEEYLADYTRSDKYTPDLSVVYGLKARAYLTMEDWANAETYAKKAQEGYALLSEDEYLSRTTGFNTPNNSSWMFATNFQSTDECILDNDADSSWGSWMIIEVSESECGYAANYGVPKHIDYHLFSTIPETDFRRKCFIDFAIDDLVVTSEEGIDKDASTEAIEALSEYSDSPEGILTTADATESKKVGGLEVKFRPNGGEHSNQYTAFTVSVPLMRVEEMYLIEAEAAGMQNEGNGISLLTDFGKTRDPNYVYGTHSSETYESDYATAFQNEVWWQRRVELWGEGFSTYDVKRYDKGVIRSYANSNHVPEYSWNIGTYTSNGGNHYPDWMDLCIVSTETNYNYDCTNNPTPNNPGTGASEEYVW